MGIEQDWGGRLRLESAELPDGLAHQPSRDFLTAEGVPETAAFLDFYTLGAPPLEAFSDAAEEGGKEHLFVLGETTYTAHAAHQGDAVLLDGVTGEVFLAGRRAGVLRRDPLATGLPQLVELLREVDAAALAAEEPEAIDGQRGPAVVAGVVDVVRQRMRAIDPALFRDDAAPPAHWDTALLVRSLAWGALPGVPDGPGSLAYEITPELVADLAELSARTDTAGIRRFHPDELPDVLTHGPTRRLLTELGLPVGGALLDVAATGPLRTMAAAHPEDFGSADEAESAAEREYQRDHLALAHWPHDLVIALDGATGRLELPAWHDPGVPAAYLNRDLSALLFALWTRERLRAEWRRWEDGRTRTAWAVFDPQALLGHVAEHAVAAVDPEAFATPDHSWQLLAGDDHMGGLLY
ncbi:SUKH-4 family immunity protein [Kitasatospora sp. A2-31]|uniref:SUKH-4 family immunity protein n=1 Tax=Kitasatospora sp. A2-31 TaxID=2916414 RepID=UPI001EEB14AC|nr:SUKH-4 family immunity protein [Kitasatospora sp. A2-31]MCG6495212.1 SUKH-4 family immunity protein [Kitasatospora sp. A2-31]